MKKRGSFIAGMLTMALLFGMVGTAYAAYQKQATLDFPGIQIVLNGEPVTPKDAAGNTVEPFTIDGTTYLPVRAIGEALGLEVGWDGSTNTVTLTSPAGEWENYIVCDCYGDFSVPSLENIVGTAALVDVYELSTGDGVLYTYSPDAFKPGKIDTFAEEYLDLLMQYGFEIERVSEDKTVYCKDAISGITVALYWEVEHHNFCVLLMNVQDSKASGIDAGTASYAWRISQYAERVHSLCDRAARCADNGTGSASELQNISSAFYDKTLPVLEMLRKDIASDQMYDLYMAAYNLTGTAEEMIYRYAKLEAGESAGGELAAYSEKEVNEYWDLLDAIGDILSPEE